MKLGILGPPQSGKTTLFAALTRGQAESGSARGEKVHLGSVKVPDARLDRLRDIYQPKKFTPAKVDYVDAPPLETSKGERGALAALSALRDVDAFVLVIRAFENPAVPHFKDTVDAARDAAWLAGELLLEDLAVIERRLDRIEKAVKVGKKPEDPNEYEALKKVTAALEAEKPARAAGLTPGSGALAPRLSAPLGPPLDRGRQHGRRGAQSWGRRRSAIRSAARCRSRRPPSWSSRPRPRRSWWRFPTMRPGNSWPCWGSWSRG